MAHCSLLGYNNEWFCWYFHKFSTYASEIQSKWSIIVVGGGGGSGDVDSEGGGGSAAAAAEISITTTIMALQQSFSHYLIEIQHSKNRYFREWFCLHPWKKKNGEKST